MTENDEFDIDITSSTEKVEDHTLGGSLKRGAARLAGSLGLKKVAAKLNPDREVTFIEPINPDSINTVEIDNHEAGNIPAIGGRPNDRIEENANFDQSQTINSPEPEVLTISEFLMDAGKAKIFCDNWRDLIGDFLKKSERRQADNYDSKKTNDVSFLDMFEFTNELNLPMVLWSGGSIVETTNRGVGHWYLLLSIPKPDDTQVHVYDPMKGELFLKLDEGETYETSKPSHVYKNQVSFNQRDYYSLEMENTDDNEYLKSKTLLSQNDRYNCGIMCVFNMLLRTNALHQMPEETRQRIANEFALNLPTEEQLKSELGIKPPLTI